MSIRVLDLSKEYVQAGRQPQRAVDAISFAAQPGEIVGFLGPNGAGKSTTMKIATGVALVEYRAEDPNVPIKPLHKLSVAQASKELKAVGLRLLTTDKRLPQQHILFFGK